MQRLLVLSGMVAGSLAVAAGAVADSSAPARYHRLKVDAAFIFVVQHGSHPQSSWNGEYAKTIYYELRAIVAYNKNAISIPVGSAIVAGSIRVDDDRTKLDPRTGTRLRLCAKPDKDLATGKGTFSRFVVSPGANVSVAGGRLRTDPGRFLPNYSGCGDGDLYHGLQGGPSFSVPAPKLTRFAGTERFSIYCTYEYSHDFKPRADELHSHTFDGVTFFRVQFTPVPPDQVEATRDWLQNTIGKEGGVVQPPGKAKACR